MAEALVTRSEPNHDWYGVGDEVTPSTGGGDVWKAFWALASSLCSFA